MTLILVFIVLVTVVMLAVITPIIDWVNLSQPGGQLIDYKCTVMYNIWQFNVNDPY